MSVQKDINDLPNEMLCLILEFFPSKKLFQCERVNKNWQKCTKHVIAQRITLFRKKDHGSREKNISVSGSTILVPRLFNKNYFDVIKNILIKCSNIKTLDLDGLYMPGINYLISIIHLFPNLEQVCFCNRFRVKEKQMFNHLNSCKNLMKLKWDGHPSNDLSDPNCINVLQRVQHLDIDFSSFLRLKCPMDNLVELTITDTINRRKEDDETKFDYSGFEQMNKMTFLNLKRFNLKISAVILKMIENLEFPQLESVDLLDYHSPPKELSQRFYNQIKNTKIFVCRNIQFTEGNLVAMKNLTDLSACDWQRISYQLEMSIGIVNDLIKHNSLQKIYLPHFCCSFDVELLDKIITLGKTKPTANIRIELNCGKLDEQQTQTLNDYKQKLKENSWDPWIRIYEEKCEIYLSRNY